MTPKIRIPVTIMTNVTGLVTENCGRFILKDALLGFHYLHLRFVFELLLHFDNDKLLFLQAFFNLHQVLRHVADLYLPHLDSACLLRRFFGRGLLWLRLFSLRCKIERQLEFLLDLSLGLLPLSFYLFFMDNIREIIRLFLFQSRRRHDYDVPLLIWVDEAPREHPRL